MQTGFISVMALLVLVLVASGCASQPGDSPPRTSVYAPQNIDMFMSVTEGDTIRFFFTLFDAAGANTPGDGSVSFVIFDQANRTVYSDEFDVRAWDFVDYEFRMTGQPLGKAYEWRVNMADIAKGVGSFGAATIRFTTVSGKTMTATSTLVEIPAHTEEKLEQINEQGFLSSAVQVDRTLTKGTFQVTVKSVGQYEPLGLLIGDEPYFRVDMEVKNVGAEREYFSPTGMVIIASGSQYETTWGGTLDTFSQMYPGVTKAGYVLFSPVPGTVDSVKLVFDLGYDEDFNPYTFEYDIDLG